MVLYSLDRLLIFSAAFIRLSFRLCICAVVAVVLMMIAYSAVQPLPGLYMMSEARRLGGFERDWAPIEEMAPVIARSVVAAEDANFCAHNGVDWDELFEVIEEGASRGASTIT
ncbi:MAG: transglycosylase domain-containing protein, partial [Pseudomonadota bacterium]